MKYKFRRALVLAPHTDDGEFGCGGTIAKLSELGTEVFYVAFSSCEESVPMHLASDTLRNEIKRATVHIGIQSSNLIILDYKVRKFASNRQPILEDIVSLRNNYKPDLVFIPSTCDIHQDHKVIAMEGVRAFKNTTVLSYEMIWNTLSFNYNCFFDLNESHIESKCKAISEYKSQSHRKYAQPEFIKAQALCRGIQVSRSYAETFEAVRVFF